MTDIDPIELNCMYKKLVKIRQHEEDLARGIENMSLPTGEVLEEEGNDALNIEDNAVLINTVPVDDGLKNEVLVIPEGEEIHTRTSCCREKVSWNPKLGVIILGEMAEDTLLQEKATPDSSSVKRALKVSPDTLVGRTRKVSIGESSPVLREITSSELVRSYSCSGQERSGARGWRKTEDGIARSLSFGNIKLLDATRIKSPSPRRRRSNTKLSGDKMVKMQVEPRGSMRKQALISNLLAQTEGVTIQVDASDEKIYVEDETST